MPFATTAFWHHLKISMYSTALRQSQPANTQYGEAMLGSIQASKEQDGLVARRVLVGVGLLKTR